MEMGAGWRGAFLSIGLERDAQRAVKSSFVPPLFLPLGNRTMREERLKSSICWWNSLRSIEVKASPTKKETFVRSLFDPSHTIRPLQVMLCLQVLYIQQLFVIVIYFSNIALTCYLIYVGDNNNRCYSTIIDPKSHFYQLDWIFISVRTEKPFRRSPIVL